MKNPIPKSSFYVTPKSLEEIQTMLNGVGTPEEQRMAWYGAMLAFNLAHDLVEAEHIKENV